jgi:DNA polymerase III subunit gamma/tau
LWDTVYRPLRFIDVLGQEGNVQLLKSRLRNGTAFDTSYIFAGAFGRGKTTLSRIHARAMLCMDLDKSDPEPCNKCDNCTTILEDQPGPFTERDAASHGTIEHARKIVEELPYVLVNAPKRIYLFDEAHRITVPAQDVMLKPVEEKKMVGMFCTTEPEKIRGAIRSRCEEYTIRKVSRDEILKRMRMILEAEKVEAQDDAVYIVIDHSGGHVRDVINKLEMISQLGPITVENVRSYLHLSVITLYYKILLSLDSPAQAIELIEQACEQVTPEEVSVGLAEAAMNTYRVANGIYADFSFVDKGLAEKVYSKYQSEVVRFAYWFLGAKRATTKLSLTRDVIVFSQSPGNLPLEKPSPPVVFAGTTAPQPVSAPDPAPTNTPQESSEPATDEYADPTEPTDVEAHVVKSLMPRVRSAEVAPPLANRNRTTHTDMTPDEWGRIFERLLSLKPV